MENELIKVSHLFFGYDKEIILDDVSFTVTKGDFVGIIGSNGTGKSTLIKLLLGQLSPIKGSIELINKDISGFKDWSKLGYVAQIGSSTGAIFPATAKEIVMLNLYSHIGFLRFPKKEHYKKAENVLSLVGIEDLGNSQISKLSGGQQQRVMIARALVNDPEILILDEPTTGIDAKSEESLFNLLDYINKNLGVTIIMVTHQHNRLSHVNKLLCIEDNKVNEVDMNSKEIIDNDI